MKVTLYSNIKSIADITITCAAVRQHIWNKMIIVGPSKSGIRKLNKFIAAHRAQGENMPYTNFGGWGTQYDGYVLQ